MPNAPNKTVTYNGKTYPYKFAYKTPEGVLMFVCETDELLGPKGDEVPAAECSEVVLEDGTKLHTE